MVKIAKKKSYKKWFSRSEREAFKDGLVDYPCDTSKYSVKERKSYDRGKAIGQSKDYQIAERYTNHMNRKFGWFKKTEFGRVPVCDKRGRDLGIDGEPLPTTYDNYKAMQKDPKLKKSLYEEYDFENHCVGDYD